MLTLMEVVRYLKAKKSWVNGLGEESWKENKHLFKVNYEITTWIDFWIFMVILSVISIM